jgi:hypothetical protein
VAPHAPLPRHSEWRRTSCHATGSGDATASATPPWLAWPKGVIPVKYFQKWFIIWNSLKFELILFKSPVRVRLCTYKVQRLHYPISADPCEVSALQKGHELLETCSTVASGSGAMADPGSGVVWRLRHCTAPSGLIGLNLGMMIRHRPTFVRSYPLASRYNVCCARVCGCRAAASEGGPCRWLYT